MARADKAADADRSTAGDGGDGFSGSGNVSGGTQRGGSWLVFRIPRLEKLRLVGSDRPYTFVFEKSLPDEKVSCESGIGGSG